MTPPGRPATPLAAAVRRREQGAVIDLRGDVDGRAETALAAAYDEAEASGARTIVLNFAAVGYVNSTGIALIVGVLARARPAGRRLSVVGLSEHYREIFAITRLSEFMPVYPDEASALAGPSGG